MIGVLIVDDETIVRYGVKSMIDWGKLGLTVVAEAANGQEALALFKQLNPEIVITDVKMPVMDGIELIKAIRTVSQETKIVILSCYQDFSYAREAMRFGASEYLIKSDIMPADLEGLLTRIKDNIHVDRTKQVAFSEIQKKTLKNEAIGKEKFFEDLAMGVVARAENFQEDLRQLGIEYLDGGLTVLNIRICYFDKVTCGLTEKGKKELHGKVAKLIDLTLDSSPYFRGEVYPGNGGEINIVGKPVNSPGVGMDREIIDEFGKALTRRVKTEYGYIIGIGVSERFDHLQELKQAYEQAQKACKFRIFSQCGQVIYYCDIRNGANEKNKVAKVNIKELQDYVYFLKRDQVGGFLNNLFESLLAARDDESVHLISLELVLVLNNVYAEIARDNEDVLLKKKEYYEQIKLLETVEDIRGWFQNTFEQLMNYIQEVYNNDRNIITKAMNFIHVNYQQDLSLVVVSEHVHLSKNYFANLFKQEVGESFVEYLTKFRMDRAKLLLENSDYKTYEIGNLVGINDSHYFSKVFKKITGLTPTEYKEVYHK